jgi:hypothetical protein
VEDESNNILGKLFTLISLYIKPKIRVYKTAIADASVAVNMPETIPPISRLLTVIS